MAHLNMCCYPLRQLPTNTLPAISLVQKNNGGIVPGMADGTAYGLIHRLHAQVLVVYLARKLPIRVPRLGTQHYITNVTITVYSYCRQKCTLCHDYQGCQIGIGEVVDWKQPWSSIAAFLPRENTLHHVAAMVVL